jgi:hypothetical protein
MPVKKRPTRTKKNKPLLDGRPKGVFYPDLVGRRGYPKTLEAFENKQRLARERFAKWRADGTLGTRRGVPDGWAGKKVEVAAERDRARAEGKELIATMIEQDLIDTGLTTDDKKAQDALEMLAEVMLDKTGTTRERVAAATALLGFTKAKPAQKTELKVSKAEDFLAILAAEENPET